MSVEYRIGDVFDRMAELPDASVDFVLTSPPFLALRSYLPADHPDKHKEIGSEVTPSEFIDTLLRLTAEWRRLLTPHGSIAIELGDTYSGSGGAGGDYGENGLREGQERFDGSGRLANYADARGNPDGMRDPTFSGANTKTGGGSGWPLAKSLTLIPEAYRFALAYGINPHSGRQSPAGQWRVRNVVRWVRPNPPVGALGDKFRPATSELAIACTSDKRWFDLDAVRNIEAVARNNHRPQTVSTTAFKGSDAGQRQTWDSPNPAGAPPLDWWKISPKGYAGAHYAVWPSELCVKPIKAMCPREVCRECGEPRRRIVDVSYTPHSPETIEMQHQMQHGRAASGTSILGVDASFPHGRADKNVTTLGWSDCGHDDYRPGLVLDPFAGTGTTLAVAHGHGRDAIGIDIDERSAELARGRVGPLFLEIT